MMEAKILVSALLLLLVSLWASPATAAAVQDEPCTLTVGDKFFDLRPLIKTSGADYVAKDAQEESKYIYRMNVCAQIMYNGTVKNPVSSKVAVHQQEVANEDRHWDLGRVSTKLVYVDGLLTLTYADGDICRHTNDSRTAVVQFICSHSAGVGQPVFLHESGECDYIFDWETKYACPSSGSLSAGAIFGIVCLVLFVSYFGCIFAFRTCYLGKRGIEQIPHYHACANVCGALKCWGGQKSVHYRNLPGQDRGISLMEEDDFDDDAEDAEERT